MAVRWYDAAAVAPGGRMSAAYVRARARVTGTLPFFGVSRALLQRTKIHAPRDRSGVLRDKLAGSANKTPTRSASAAEGADETTGPEGSGRAALREGASRRVLRASGVAVEPAEEFGGRRADGAEAAQNGGAEADGEHRTGVLSGGGGHG